MLNNTPYHVSYTRLAPGLLNIEQETDRALAENRAMG